MERLLHLLLRGTATEINPLATVTLKSWWRRTSGMFILAGALGFSSAAFASASNSNDTSLEHRIKSAYLFNFTKFVEWPSAAFAETNAPFTIGVLATNPGDLTAAAVVETLHGKKSGSRLVEVRMFDRIGPDLPACHVIFVTESARHELAAIRKAIGNRPVLIVGESESFAQQGGTINLAVTGDTVRCEINLRQAERTGLKLSGRLASVARLVREESNP
jgi:hypothetical protein